jgi:hypothetical protein
MITKFGFGKTLGLYAPRDDDGSGKLAVSDSVVRRVDEEVKVHYIYIYINIYMYAIHYMLCSAVCVMQRAR